MLWRIRALLPDRPGTLAVLARACGEAGADIKAVQVFTAHDATVTDELVVRTPEDWTEDHLADLMTRAGGVTVAALRCTDAALVDQPTRYVAAARAILAQPASFPEVVARLFDADVSPSGYAEDVMEMNVANAVVQVRRTTPFTATERARGAAMADLVSDVLTRHTPPAPVTPAGGLGPEFISDATTVTALVAGAVVGRATLSEPAGESWAVKLWVDPAWQRRGIGTRLLTEAVRLAGSQGAAEVVLTAPAESRAVLPLVLSAGLRGRIRMACDTLTVRIAVADLRVA